MSGWSGVLKDFFRQIDDGSVTLQEVQAFLEHRNPFPLRSLETKVWQWQEFYKKYFCFDCDFSQVKIPGHRHGFERLIVVAEDLTLNQVYGVLAKQFSCWRWTDDLDKAVSHNNRSSTISSYAIWVRDRVEADEELENLSADQLKEQGIPGITLMERLLYELKYWSETGGKHLDVLNWTLCAGSRYSDGRVPGVRWRNDHLELTWHDSHRHPDGLRCRAVVS